MFRWSFLTPKCSFLKLSFDNNVIFFPLQKLFSREFVSARVFSVFLLSFRKIMFDKLNEVLGEVLLVLLPIFFTFDSKFTSFVRSFVSTWMIFDSGFLSSASSFFVKMSVLVAPEIFSTSTFLFSIIHGCWYHLAWSSLYIITTCVMNLLFSVGCRYLCWS